MLGTFAQQSARRGRSRGKVGRDFGELARTSLHPHYSKSERCFGHSSCDDIALATVLFRKVIEVQCGVRTSAIY